MSNAVDLLKTLVSIDSINPDLVPGSAGEAAIAQYVADWLKREGFEVALDEPAPSRLSVIGTARGTTHGSCLPLPETVTAFPSRSTLS